MILTSTISITLFLLHLPLNYCVEPWVLDPSWEPTPKPTATPAPTITNISEPEICLPTNVCVRSRDIGGDASSYQFMCNNGTAYIYHYSDLNCNDYIEDTSNQYEAPSSVSCDPDFECTDYIKYRRYLINDTQSDCGGFDGSSNIGFEDVLKPIGCDPQTFYFSTKWICDEISVNAIRYEGTRDDDEQCNIDFVNECFDITLSDGCQYQSYEDSCGDMNENTMRNYYDFFEWTFIDVLYCGTTADPNTTTIEPTAAPTTMEPTPAPTPSPSPLMEDGCKQVSIVSLILIVIMHCYIL